MTAVADLARRRLAEAADPARAGPMQAYMKSALPFRGVQAPRLDGILRSLPDPDDCRAAVLDLWRNAAYREERYLALMLLASRRCRSLRTLDALPLYEELVVSGAWWDLVDGVSPLLGDLLPEAAAALRAWAYDDDLWKRRAAITAQRRLKERTDAQLLADCIEPSRTRPEFWLRKAIGWALREYGKVDPEAVRRYVETHELSPLSRREALRYCGG